MLTQAVLERSHAIAHVGARVLERRVPVPALFRQRRGRRPESAHLRLAGVDELTWRGLLDEVGGEHNALGLWARPRRYDAAGTRARAGSGTRVRARLPGRRRRARRRDPALRGARLAERVAQVSRTQAEQQHRLPADAAEAAEGAVRGAGAGRRRRRVRRRIRRVRRATCRARAGGMSDEERAGVPPAAPAGRGVSTTSPPWRVAAGARTGREGGGRAGVLGAPRARRRRRRRARRKRARRPARVRVRI